MTFKVNGIPHRIGTYKGLAQAPLRFENMVAELADNAIAAQDPQKIPEIRIDVSSHPSGGDVFIVKIWDNCPGIPLSRIQNEVFTLGYPPQGNNHLNEHGFGLKNVIAKTEQLTAHKWIFRTRDLSAFESKKYYECERPLSYDMSISEKDSTDWPLYSFKGTGTIIELVLPMSYLQSVAFGRRGALPRDLGRIIEYLREHLGVFYRGFLEGGVRAKIKISTSINLNDPDPIEAIQPDYRTKETHEIHANVEGKKFIIEGEIGLIDKYSKKTKEKLFYYRHTPESQGVDIRIGRRIMATRIVEEIWERERHPSLNALAGEFRIPADAGIVPPTLNNKTSLDFDSSIWQSIAASIREVISSEDLPHGGGKSEDDLRDELFQHIKGLAKPSHLVEKEHDCGHGVFVDILWDQKRSAGSIDIYEVKKGKAQAIDVYQLMMYWDALVSTKIQPTQGHLVSEGISSGVTQFIELVKNKKDANGVLYDLVCEDWAIHGIIP